MATTRFARWAGMATSRELARRGRRRAGGRSGRRPGRLGINWNFELPDRDPADNNLAELTTTNDIGPGWNYTLLGGARRQLRRRRPDRGYDAASAPQSPRSIITAATPPRPTAACCPRRSKAGRLASSICRTPIRSLRSPRFPSARFWRARRTACRSRWAPGDQRLGRHSLRLRSGHHGRHIHGHAGDAHDESGATANTMNVMNVTYTLTPAQATAFVGQDATILIRATMASPAASARPTSCRPISTTCGCPARSAP